MSKKNPRVFGTTLEAITEAEAELGHKLPLSFRNWLLENNGAGVEGIFIFPVLDKRDVKTTWDSIVRQYDNGRWFPEYFENEVSNAHYLLPFASLDSGDCYCFDYSRQQENGEVPVVWWSHETAEVEDRATSFAEFVKNAKANAFRD